MATHPMNLCAICSKEMQVGDDVVLFTDGTVAHGHCSDDVAEAQAALDDFDKSGGASLEDLRNETDS